MQWIKRTWQRLFHRANIDRDIDDEINSHLAMEIDERISAGASEGNARASAMRDFGNRTQIKETTRKMSLGTFLDGLARDATYCLRGLRRNPGFAAVAILTLALGIGANTTVFGIVRAVLLRPLALPESERIVTLLIRDDAQKREYWGNYQDFLDLREQAKSFEAFSAFTSQTATFASDGEPDGLRAGYVSSTFFRVMGVTPALGRDFQPGEDEIGAPGVAILSHGLWQRRFGGEKSVLGRVVTINNNPFTVVGVLPESYQFPWDAIDVWIRFASYPEYSPRTVAGMYARLKSGTDIQTASAEMTTVAARIIAERRETDAQRSVSLRTFHDSIVGQTLRPSLNLLWGAVGFVFLIALVNLANLMLARTLAREREFGVRAALGAGRGHLMRQLLAEGMVLALTGGVLGTALGAWGAVALAKVRADSLPRGTDASPDAVVFAFAVGLAALAALVFAVVPLAHLWRQSGASLHDSSRGTSEGATRLRARRALMTIEVALALVLLSGAGLLVRSFLNVSSIEPGFSSERLLTLEYRMFQPRYPEPEQQAEFHRRVGEKVRQIPGVESATVIRAIPFSGNGFSIAYSVPGQSPAPRGSEPRAQGNGIDSSYFGTMGIPLYRGRAFRDSDRIGSAPVVIVNRHMAQQLWPDRDPIGQTLVLGTPPTRPGDDPPQAYTVVGVVGDTLHYNLEDKQQPQFYLSFAQWPTIFGGLAVKTHSDPEALARSVREAFWSVDKDQAVWKVRTMETMLDSRVAYRRFMATLTGVFAAFALLLAALGVYGVISYSTGRRTREIGLRIAMGAVPSDVLRLILRQSLAMTGAGIALGVAGSLWVTRLLKGQLYGVEPSDPLTLGGVAVLLGLVAFAAGLLPARRAAKLQPVVALRAE